jgi:hypothetical protein
MKGIKVIKKNWKRSFCKRSNYLTIILFITLSILSGCAGSSTQYQRKHVPKGEIIWAYDGGLKVFKDGMFICDDDWDRLPEAVSCVPDAKRFAESARSDHNIGKTLQWTSLGVFITSFALGMSALSDDLRKSDEIDADDNPLSYKSFWLLIGGVTIGIPLALYSNDLLWEAPVEAMNAVNIYNSTFQNHKECIQDSSASELNKKE